MSQGLGSRPGQNKLKRESSILSYFSKKESDKTAIVSAKNLKQAQPVSKSSSTTPLTTRQNSHPFGASKSITKEITNDSKYIDAGLYGDQKLIFSSQITAKRTNTTLAAPKVAPKPAQDHAVFEDLIDLTEEGDMSASINSTIKSASSGFGNTLGNESVSRPRIASFADRQQPNGQTAGQPSVSGSSSASRAWNVGPKSNNFSPSSRPVSVENSTSRFEVSYGRPSAMKGQPFKVASGASNSSQAQSRPMFGNPAFSSASTQSKKRMLPSMTFSDAKRGRASDTSPSSSQGSTGEITLLGQYSLSAEQNAVLKMAMFERKSLFFTGSAGTGKSILLREIIAQMRRKYGSGIAVTASTGIAACNIGGLTLHSFAGIGLGHDSVEKLVKRILSMKQVYRRWTSISVLVIDEISMIDGGLFDKLEQIARQVRKNTSPFGGIQLILTGDFFQLPPVGKDRVAKYCFESQSWSKVVEKNVMLTHVFRQKDGDFVRMLNEMRLNQMSTSTIDKFKSLSRTPKYADDSIQPTRLFALRNQVEIANNDRLRHLTGATHRYTANDWGDQAKLNGCMAPVELELKMDAQVMLIKNLTPSLVNGSTGIVIGFTNEGQFTSEGSIQSRLLDKEKSNNVSGGGRKEEMVIPTEIYPIVRFVNGQEVVIQPERWEVELPGGELAATRTQIPLMLAWALSIHKSQGQTLDRVFVDLGSVFEKGQAYVALSRATDMNSLQVLNFNPSKVVADPRVVGFYQQLSCV